MKVLIHLFGAPFYLAHGGAQTQVLETARGLRELGVEVEFTRWWDGKQSADLIHAFGAPNSTYIRFAKSKHLPIISSTLFTATCNRSPRQLAIQGMMVSGLLRLPRVPLWSAIRSQLNWETFKQCDKNIVGLEAEKNVLKTVYGVPAENIGIIPLGLAQSFLEAGHGDRSGDYLITTGTITERKRSVELARMAHLAKVPICFVGKPYDDSSAYWKEFKSLVDGVFVKHVGHTESVGEMIELLKSSRGYVLFSDYENWCLSAHEAIACGLPILVPDQPWSRELFASEARYFHGWNIDSNARRLKDYYQECDTIPTPNLPLYSWRDVASKLLPFYNQLL